MNLGTLPDLEIALLNIEGPLMPEDGLKPREGPLRSKEALWHLGSAHLDLERVLSDLKRAL